MTETRDQVATALFRAISLAMNVPIDELSEDTQVIGDLGAKSVNLVRIIANIEDEFDIDVSFKEFRGRKTIGEQVDYLVQLCDT